MQRTTMLCAAPRLRRLVWIFLGCAGVVLGAAELPSAALSHPVLAEQARDRRLREDPEKQAALAEQVLAMDREQLLALIRSDNGMDVRFPCRACGNALEVTLDTPDTLICRGCGAHVNNDTLPPSGQIEGLGPQGDRIVFSYHQEGWHKRFPEALLTNRRHALLVRAARALGRRYLDTGEEAYAGRAIDILERFAAVFPRWPVIEVRAFPRPSQYVIGPERPYDHWAHYKWRHTNNYDIPEDLTFAYDFVYNSEEWKRRPGAREAVENDLLRAGYTQAWTTHEDMGLAVNNLSGTMLASTILLGRTLGDPEMIHRAVFTLKNMLRVFYHFDGMEHEGALTYHGTVTGRCGIAERMLRGYSDPPNYRDNRYGIRLEDFDLGREIPVYARAWQVWNLMRLPNGNQVCVHDSELPKSRGSVEPTTPMPAITLNAYGHFAMGYGQGLNGVQAHLHFCPFARMGHYHNDKLAIILFGAGEEVLSDIGYVHVGRKNRYFANASISHNTVTVEYDTPGEPVQLQKADQEIIGTLERPKHTAAANRPYQDAKSTLIAYDPGIRSGKRVQVLAASAPGAADSRLEQRTRELLLIALDESRACLLDIFRIRGGSRHNFVLRPSSDETVHTTTCSLALGEQRPGTLAGAAYPYGQVPREKDRTIAYSWLVQALRTAPAADDWQLTWTGEDSGAQLRLFMGGMTDAELWLGTSPSMRRAQNNDTRADDFQNPHLVLRRPENGAGATFAAAYETVPQGADPLIETVRFTRPQGEGATDPVTVQIQTRDGVQITANVSCSGIPGAQAIQPAYQVTAVRDDQLLWEWTHGAADRKNPVPEQRPLQDVLRLEDGDPCNGFLVSGRPDALPIEPGEWVRVLYGEGRAYGYEVKDIRRQGDATLVEINGEPGFELYDGGMRLLYHPFYETPGACRLEFPLSAFAGDPTAAVRPQER